MFLTSQDAIELVQWRRKLHARPELSGLETETASEVRAFLATARPDRVISDLGGHGVAAIHSLGKGVEIVHQSGPAGDF